MQKKFNKWFEKIKKGTEGYEGISYEKGRLLHVSETHEARLELLKIMMIKSDGQVEEIIWSVDDNKEEMKQLRIFIKNAEELLLSFDCGKEIYYFGDDEKLLNQSSEIQEVFIYIEGEYTDVLIHAEKADKVEYIVNMSGARTTFIRKIYEVMQEAQKHGTILLEGTLQKNQE